MEKQDMFFLAALAAKGFNYAKALDLIRRMERL